MYRGEKRRIITVKETVSLYEKSNWQKNNCYWQNGGRGLEMSNKKRLIYFSKMKKFE